MNKKLQIVAPSQVELLDWLKANRWVNHEHVQRVLKPQDIDAGAPLLLGLPGWNLSPTITDPKGILQRAHALGVQVLVLERAAYDLTPSITIPPTLWPDDESRVDVIGQNGNTGEHYDQLVLAERFNSECG